jgi:hypothetical protein
MCRCSFLCLISLFPNFVGVAASSGSTRGRPRRYYLDSSRMDRDPDPNPLLPFLIPAPPPPRSTPAIASSSNPAPDLKPPSPDLQPEGSHVEAHSAEGEVQAAQDQVHGLPLPAPPPVSSPPTTEAPSIQQPTPAQVPPQPASPTLIDPDLCERGWALLPDLAKDLNRLKEQRAGIEDGEPPSIQRIRQRLLAINPPARAIQRCKLPKRVWSRRLQSSAPGF